MILSFYLAAQGCVFTFYSTHIYYTGSYNYSQALSQLGENSTES